ncbi:ATPase [Pseudoxanthomonas wuyuanensis]|nr:ATPase [Pseudoxanthomonas wuyuanensis]
MHVLPEDLVEFADAALAADYTRLRKVGQRIAKALEASDADAETARRFRISLNRKGVPLRASGYSEALPLDSKSRLPLLEELPWPNSPVFLDSSGKEQFSAFLTDVTNHELLASKGLASRLALMLSGPPGTGKTLLAGHLASQLGRKLYVARLDSIISSMLGDTAKNVRSIFDFVAGKHAVLFLDELDAIAKMRDDRHELGELKRVVNTVIQGLDSLDESTIVVAATNHAQILDKAIWRRFPYKIEFGHPDLDLRHALWSHFLSASEDQDQQISVLSRMSNGMSGADIEQHALAARRRSVLDSSPLDMASLGGAILNKKVDHRGDASARLSDLKRRLAHHLVNECDIAQSETARFLGVSRQAVSAYLKATTDAQ